MSETESEPKETTAKNNISPNDLIGGYVGQFNEGGEEILVIMDIRSVESMADKIKVSYDFNYGDRSNLNNSGFIMADDRGSIVLSSNRKLKYKRDANGSILFTLYENQQKMYTLKKVND